MDLGGVTLLRTGLVHLLWPNPPLIPSTITRHKFLTAPRTLRRQMLRITEEDHLITVITVSRHHPIMEVRDILGPSSMVVALTVIMHLMDHHQHLHTTGDREDTMITTDPHPTTGTLHRLIHRTHRNLRRIHTDTPLVEAIAATMIRTLPMPDIMDDLLLDLTMNTTAIITTLTILITNITTIIKSRRMRNQV